MSDAAVSPSTTLAQEEQARANIYGLLSRLFAAPADAQLLQGIAATGADGEDAASDHGGAFARAWRDLAQAAGTAAVDAVSDEYQALFVGAGRAQVSLYVGAYMAKSAIDTPLVALRTFLRDLGLQRQKGVNEPEDHISLLFEIMRYMISEQESVIEEQRSFFERFIWFGGCALCDAISTQADAAFYRAVASFAKRFMHIEHEAFCM